MTEKLADLLDDLYHQGFPSFDERSNHLVMDEIAQKYVLDVVHSSDDEKPALEARTNTYLAAAHMIFPDEAKQIYAQLDRGRISE